MPTYDYECTKCGHVFEMLQSITARPKRKPDEPCAGCGERAPIKRLIGAGGAVIFKGSGFYETDYRSESYKKAAKAEKESASADSKGGVADKASSTASDKAAGQSASKEKGQPAAKGEASPKAAKPDKKRQDKKR